MSDEQKAYFQPIWASFYFGDNHTRGDAHQVFSERLSVERARAKEICHMMFYNRNSWGCINYINNLRSERFVLKMELVEQIRKNASAEAFKDAFKVVDKWMEQEVDKLLTRRKTTPKC